jgi:hypothetical protein
VETVACEEGQPGCLPVRAGEELDGWHYDFRAAIDQPDAGTFAGQVAALTRTVGSHPCGLVGQFPGFPLAVTVLLAEAGQGGVGWRTWHTYPQTLQIVTTESRLEPR